MLELKAEYYYASILIGNFSIWLWDRPKIYHFYDFGISGHVPERQNQLCLFLDTPQKLQIIKEKPQIHFPTSELSELWVNIFPQTWKRDLARRN